MDAKLETVEMIAVFNSPSTGVPLFNPPLQACERAAPPTNARERQCNLPRKAN